MGFFPLSESGVTPERSSPFKILIEIGSAAPFEEEIKIKI